MFDIGFFELLIIGVVGLLVIGPERLPETARTVLLWWGRLRRSISSTRDELEKHIGTEEVRRQLYNEEVLRRIEAQERKLRETINNDISAVNDKVNQTLTIDDQSTPESDETDTSEHEESEKETRPS